MFYGKWKIKNVVVLGMWSATHLEAFLIKHGVLFLACPYCFRCVQRCAHVITCLLCQSLICSSTLIWATWYCHTLQFQVTIITRSQCTCICRQCLKFTWLILAYISFSLMGCMLYVEAIIFGLAFLQILWRRPIYSWGKSYQPRYRWKCWWICQCAPGFWNWRKAYPWNE